MGRRHVDILDRRDLVETKGCFRVRIFDFIETPQKGVSFLILGLVR